MSSARAAAAAGAAARALRRSLSSAPRRRLSTTVDQDEVRRFSAQAAEWWAADGPAKGLHTMNEVRVPFIVSGLQTELGLPKSTACTRNENQPLSGVRILDVGCGGGILAEPLARLGANVVGIDATQASVEMARAHAAGQADIVDRIAYRLASAEEVAGEGMIFDAVVCSEVLEHVLNLPGFLATLAALVRPGGSLAMTTISRTPASFALAILTAEYVMKLVPSGTHNWRRFLRPEELSAELRRVGLETQRAAGFAYNPFINRWSVTDDLAVNYALLATKPDITPPAHFAGAATSAEKVAPHV